MGMTGAERQAAYRERKAKIGKCSRCPKRAQKGRTKCAACADASLAAAYISQGRPVPVKLQKRIAKHKA